MAQPDKVDKVKPAPAPEPAPPAAKPQMVEVNFGHGKVRKVNARMATREAAHRAEPEPIPGYQFVETSTGEWLAVRDRAYRNPKRIASLGGVVGDRK